jgi:hypothetical protein
MEWNLFVLILHIYLCFYVSGVPKIGKNSIIFTVVIVVSLVSALRFSRTNFDIHRSVFKLQTAILPVLCVMFQA